MGYRGHMNQEERAKQFMPFAALKGYPEALRKKEKIVVPKMELSQEYQEELDWKIHQIQKNDLVTVVYFFKGEYLQKKGIVSRMDTSARVIQIVNTKICMDDLYDIYLENYPQNNARERENNPGQSQIQSIQYRWGTIG